MHRLSMNLGFLVEVLLRTCHSHLQMSTRSLAWLLVQPTALGPIGVRCHNHRGAPTRRSKGSAMATDGATLDYFLNIMMALSTVCPRESWTHADGSSGSPLHFTSWDAVELLSLVDFLRSDCRPFLFRDCPRTVDELLLSLASSTAVMESSIPHGATAWEEKPHLVAGHSIRTSSCNCTSTAD